jgi:hypothetical protein
VELITTVETLDGLIRTRRTKNRWFDRGTSAYDFDAIMTDHRTRRSTRDANRRSRVRGRDAQRGDALERGAWRT